MGNQPPKRSIKGPLIILGIILLIVILLIAIPYALISYKSKKQCGEGGRLLGSANKGYYCGYHSFCEECQNATQCPDCTDICESKGKIKRDGWCGPNSIDLTGKIKVDNEGNFYSEDIPVNCYCCCNENEGD